MSRTDKTKPWRVRIAEHNPLAVHEHADGICDLPSDPYDVLDGPIWAGHCHWGDEKLTTPGSCCYGCGCRMCTNYDGRRTDRRRSRHEARHANRNAMKLHNYSQ